jgi:hypothetical protein
MCLTKRNDDSISTSTSTSLSIFLLLSYADSSMPRSLLIFLQRLRILADFTGRDPEC